MKKLLTSVFMLLALLTFTNHAEAQLAARGGLVFANQKISFSGISATADNKIGAQLGATYTRMLNDKFNFRPGIMYTMKGASADGDSGTLGYVGVPLDFVYGVPVSDKALNFHVGPYVDFLLHGSDDATDALKTLDFGLNLGAELDFGQFGIGLNISRGLSNVSNTEFDDGLGGGIITLGDISVKNQFFSLFATYDL